MKEGSELVEGFDIAFEKSGAAREIVDVTVQCDEARLLHPAHESHTRSAKANCATPRVAVPFQQTHHVNSPHKSM